MTFLLVYGLVLLGEPWNAPIQESLMQGVFHVFSGSSLEEVQKETSIGSLAAMLTKFSLLMDYLSFPRSV